MLNKNVDEKYTAAVLIHCAVELSGGFSLRQSFQLHTVNRNRCPWNILSTPTPTHYKNHQELE